jgi:hypothetical protein
MYRITLAYDESSPHWSCDYEDEMQAWKTFFDFVDWGFADKYSTVNIYTPSLKCYTKIFYREDRRVVVK